MSSLVWVRQIELAIARLNTLRAADFDPRQVSEFAAQTIAEIKAMNSGLHVLILKGLRRGRINPDVLSCSHISNNLWFSLNNFYEGFMDIDPDDCEVEAFAVTIDGQLAELHGRLMEMKNKAEEDGTEDSFDRFDSERVRADIPRFREAVRPSEAVNPFEDPDFVINDSSEDVDPSDPSNAFEDPLTRSKTPLTRSKSLTLPKRFILLTHPQRTWRQSRFGVMIVCYERLRIRLNILILEDTPEDLLEQ
ncbi:hypothetical protein PG994_006201 [Apiospora phragmitis]|uniref:Uncharacterized protein n=1 Tax=Apiospora phragmitis TaxID=2905665 RepID=A0ABR1VEE3_9PEZI